ncbi:MAG: ECF transporter S component [Dialister sp.]|nr:ECF transporter S component [Dialister sp.]
MKSEEVSTTGSFMSVRELTIAGLLAAITIFLGITGYGFIPLVFMKATILHVPTIIGAIVAGPKVGVMVGFLFGLFSFSQSIQAPSVMMQFIVQYNVFYDAVICIIPRMLIGLSAYFVYSALRTSDMIRTFAAAVAGALANTVLFLGSIFILVGVPYAEAQGLSITDVAYLLGGITIMNGIPEALVSAVIVVPVVMAIHRAGLHKK